MDSGCRRTKFLVWSCECHPIPQSSLRLPHRYVRRERVPLDWAMTQNNLGNALARLGERESGTARLEEAVAAFDASLTVVSSVWPPDWVHQVRTSRDEMRIEIERRKSP